MKIVVSVNRVPGEPLPTGRQIRLALGKMTAEAVTLLEKWDHSPWMTLVREIEGRK